MSAFESVREHYQLFGSRGVWLAAVARLRRSKAEILVSVPGLKHPVHLRLRTSDISTFRQVLITSEYDSEFTQPPRIVVDAGANIGLASVFYANKYPNARILAIEPEPANFRLLQKNVLYYPRIIPLQAALWKDSEELTIVDQGCREWGFQTIAAGTPVAQGCRDQKHTRGVNLNILMKDYGLEFIDLLKVDIEGSEKEVFENAQDWVGRVGAIAIELHDQLKPGCSRAFAEATSEFSSVLKRGETVFVARPGNMLEEENRFRGNEGVRVTEGTLQLPCRIVKASFS
jgi:FkbM family methyltransferase